MARQLISSNATIKAVRAGDGRRRLNDGDGLYLLLFVKGGSHCWRFDYSFNGLRKTISFGTYPDTSLSLARKKADESRQLVRNDLDPSAVRQAARKVRARERSGEVVVRSKPSRASGMRRTPRPGRDSFEDPRSREGR